MFPPASLLFDSVSSTDWAMLGACLALAVATLTFIFYIQPDASDLAPHRTKLDQLLERRDTIYDNLRDLRFEFRSGKYAESDFEAMKISLENEAAMVLKRSRPRRNARPHESIRSQAGRRALVSSSA